MSTWLAAEEVVLVVRGAVVPLQARHRLLLLRLLAALPEVDASRAGQLTLHYNGNSVAAVVAPVRGRSKRALGRGTLEEAG